MELTRRTVLGVAVAGIGTTGCLGGETPPPATVADDTQCADCGMVIATQPGPAGQTVYEGDSEPTQFCSTVCAYRHRFDHSGGVTVTYLTDYSTVDYRVQSSPLVVSAHLDTAAFTEEDALKLVVGSSLEGAMGPALVPFSESSDAASVTNEHGGEVIDAGEVTETMVAER